jgi:hypothetical protein
MAPTRPRSPEWMCLFLSLLFVALLLVPLAHRLLGLNGSEYATKSEAAPPLTDPKLLLQPEYYQAWNHLADTCLAAGQPLVQVKQWLDYHLFAMSDAPGVYIGREGWRFDRGSIDTYRKNGCNRRMRMRQLIEELEAAARIAEISGRRFIFSVAPDKATIYPEYVGAVPRDRTCTQSLYDLLLTENERHPIKGFVRLDRAMRNAKRNPGLLYDPSGSYWNPRGAGVAAQVLLQGLVPPAALHGVPPDADWIRTVALHVPSTSQDALPTGQAAPKAHPSAAVIYGGPVLTHLLPYLQPRYKRIDLVAGRTVPSVDHHEEQAAYDTILIVVTESQLADLQLNTDAFCRMLTIESAATSRSQVPLQALSPEKHISLQLEAEHLLIKSTGPDAFFSLPLLSGSDTRSLRVLALDLKAPHADTLSWGPTDQSGPGGTILLGAGPGRIYLPMPEGPAVQLHINAGRAGGIFVLENATELTFGESDKHEPEKEHLPAAAPQPEATAQQSETSTPRPEAAAPVADITGSDQPAPSETPPPVAVAPSITLNDFEAGRIFQRRGTACDITVSGTYQGEPRSIEACVSRFDTQKVVIPWTVVDRSPNNGIFMGVIASVPQGGWYRLSVRFHHHHKISAEGSTPWAVGLLAACIGQSNMKEWFFSGEERQGLDRISIYRNGAWQQPAALGCGAAAFAQRLVQHLDIPVGLLDYAVNGSGLRREADWGSGYWADRSQGSIYNQFIQGAAATGGALEYVIWMQGEADAARKTISESQYAKTLETFITRQVRHDIVNGSQLTNLPFLIVGMPRRPIGPDQSHQAIRNALTAATQQVDDCYLAAVSLDLQNHGHQHLTPEAYTALGRRTAQTVLYLLGQARYHRGPTAIRAGRVTDRIIDVDLVHRGGNDITPETGMTGFQVIDQQDNVVAIDQVQRSTPSTIRILLGRPVPGPLRVRYLYGGMPDNRHAVHDNSPLKLPLEPFDLGVE